MMLKFVFCIYLFQLIRCIPVKDCPCDNPNYCQPIKTSPQKEVYLFSSVASNYYLYDLTSVTTIAVFGEFDNNLLCFAHSKNVRVVLSATIPFDQLLNITYRLLWMEEQLINVQNHFADGINIDVEYPIANNSKEYFALTQWIEETSRIFHEAMPYCQISFDVIWSPDCVAGRCYDYLALSKALDFLVLMAYDEQGGVNGSRFQRKPNSDLITTAQGVRRFIDIGVSEAKIVVAFPWYGYDYTCISNSQTNCKIDDNLINNHNNKLQNAGTQVCYSTVMQVLSPISIDGMHFDELSFSVYFNYINDKNEFHQVWFDNAKSLSYKYTFFMKVFDLKGVAIWKGDCALNNNIYGQMMWNALPKF